MNWDDLQVFLAIARTGRISAAARRLNVEHTTVSRRLTTLETDLGVPLFYRTANGYTLTPHGQNVLSSAETMEGAAIAAVARAQEKRAEVAGLVRLALPPEFASHWLSPRLGAFRARYPQIELQILVGTRQRNLWRGEADLAIQSPRPKQQGLIAVRIGRTTMALYASRLLLGSNKMRITSVDALRGLPLLTYTSPFDLLQDARWFQPVRGAASVSVTTNSTHVLLAAARAGVGVAVLPRFIARDDDAIVVVSENVAEHDVWLVTHPESRRDPKVRVTADFLKQIARDDGGLV